MEHQRDVGHPRSLLPRTDIFPHRVRGNHRGRLTRGRDTNHPAVPFFSQQLRSTILENLAAQFSKVPWAESLKKRKPIVRAGRPFLRSARRGVGLVSIVDDSVGCCPRVWRRCHGVNLAPNYLGSDCSRIIVEHCLFRSMGTSRVPPHRFRQVELVYSELRPRMSWVDGPQPYKPNAEKLRLSWCTAEERRRDRSWNVYSFRSGALTFECAGDHAVVIAPARRTRFSWRAASRSLA